MEVISATSIEHIYEGVPKCSTGTVTVTTFQLSTPMSSPSELRKLHQYVPNKNFTAILSVFTAVPFSYDQEKYTQKVQLV